MPLNDVATTPRRVVFLRHSCEMFPPAGRDSGQIRDYRARRVVARCAGHAAARMGAGTAQVQARQRAAIVRLAEYRPRAEQLIEAQRAVEDVAADEAEVAFEIERALDLAAEHRC